MLLFCCANADLRVFLPVSVSVQENVGEGTVEVCATLETTPTDAITDTSLSIMLSTFDNSGEVVGGSLAIFSPTHSIM